MKCNACTTDNPTDAHFCSNCGVRIVDHTTGSNAAIAGLVAAVDDEPTAPLPPTMPEPARPIPSEYPSVTPPTIGEPTPPAATPAPGVATSAAAPPSATVPSGPVGAAPPVVAPPIETTHQPLRRPSTLPIIASVAAVLALVGAGAFILLATGDDDSDSMVTPTDAATVPSTTAETPSAVETTTVVATAIPAESPPDTTPPTAQPASTVLSSPPPADPAAVPLPPPEPGPVDAPGSPQVLTNVQPSGPTYAEVQTSFEIAQRFGDALALENWEVARQLSPELAGNSDDDFVQGYASTNRVSLMLRDAKPEGSGYRLLVVSVAVENGGAQTSLFCLEWAVNPVAGTVDQRGGSKLATWDGNAQPEAIRNDPAALQVVNSCTYP